VVNTNSSALLRLSKLLLVLERYQGRTIPFIEEIPLYS